MSKVQRFRPIGWIFLVGILLAVRPAAAQQEPDRAATEERLRELQRQIDEDQKRLSQTTEAERATMETLQNLDRQIALRTELIKNYRRRVMEINRESDSLRSSMAALEDDLDRLRAQYRRHAVHAYMYGRMHDLALILSAKSINQMLIRVNYLRRFAQRRREQLNTIAATGAALQERRAELEGMQARNQQLLVDAQREQRRLEQDKQQRRQVIAGLRNQRINIEKELDQRRAALRQLSARLEEIAESAPTRRRVREASDPANASALVELSGSFLQNRGRLPWPADGVVREPFGDVVNPVYGTTTPNPGILIDTPASAAVHAVFDGQVVEVSILPDFGTYVAVEHGDYQTIYSNFSATYVSEGDYVRAGQVIGRAGTDAEPRGRAVFFGLFADKRFVDPQPWLMPR